MIIDVADGNGDLLGLGLIGLEKADELVDAGGGRPEWDRFTIDNHINLIRRLHAHHVMVAQRCGFRGDRDNIVTFHVDLLFFKQSVSGHGKGAYNGGVAVDYESY